MKFKAKWNENLDIGTDKCTWQQIFSVCFKTDQDNYLIWFQYRLIHRIWGTQQMGKVQSEAYLLCHSDTECVKHILCSCPVSFQVWIDLKSWIARETGLNLYLSPQEILLGHLNRDINFLPINAIIIVTKSYIYSSFRQQKPFDIAHLQEKLKYVYEEQKLLSVYSHSEEKYNKSWRVLKKLFS